MTLEKAQELIDKLKGICEQHNKRNEQLKELIEQEKELAKARYLHGNETGAILAMKKIRRLQQERTRGTVASEVASDALTDVERAIETVANSSQPPQTVYIGEDNAYVLQDIQEALDGRSTTMDDNKELLRQVQLL